MSRIAREQKSREELKTNVFGVSAHRHHAISESISTTHGVPWYVVSLLSRQLIGVVRPAFLICDLDKASSVASGMNWIDTPFV